MEDSTNVLLHQVVISPSWIEAREWLGERPWAVGV